MVKGPLGSYIITIEMLNNGMMAIDLPDEDESKSLEDSTLPRPFLNCLRPGGQKCP